MVVSSDEPFYAGRAAGERFPQRRTAPRYFLTWDIEVCEPISRARFVTQTNVVSVRGCSIRTAISLEANTIVRLQIKWKEAIAEVWARVTGAPDDGLMGLAFLGTKHEKVLSRWIASEIGSS